VEISEAEANKEDMLTLKRMPLKRTNKEIKKPSREDLALKIEEEAISEEAISEEATSEEAISMEEEASKADCCMSKRMQLKKKSKRIRKFS
jgi:hypothetical protein